MNVVSKGDASVCGLLATILFLIITALTRYACASKCQLGIPEALPNRHFYYNGTSLPLIIETSDRPSHQLVSRLLRILLTQVLGYSDVQLDERYNSMNATQILRRISGPRRGGVPETMINLEVWVPSGFNMEALISRGSLANGGPLGPLGRFGWYMPASTVESVWAGSRLPIDHWKALKLNQVTSLFALRDEEEMLRHLLLTRPESVRRSTNCDEGLGGCPSGVYVGQPRCEGKQGVCAVLLSSTPDKDDGVLQQQINDLDLGVKIAWIGSHLDSFVRDQSAAGVPTLFFNWSPNDLTSGSNFTRVMFPACQPSSGVPPGDCDFEVHQLTKIMWGVLKSHTPEAYHLVSSMELLQDHVDSMLRRYADLGGKVSAAEGSQSGGDLLERAACEWARENARHWMKWIPDNLSTRTPIYIGGLFPLTGPVWRQPAIVPGAQMAIDYVNSDPSILGNYDLYLLLKDTQCKVDVAMTQFLQYAVNKTYPIAGILGPGCSETAEPIAGVSKHFNTIVISYSAEALQLTNRALFPLFLRTVPHILQNGPVYVELFKAWGWEQVALLAEDSKYYPEYNAFLRDRFLSRSIQVAYDRKMPRLGNFTDAEKYIDELRKKDVKIIILTSFENLARAVICAAFLKGMTLEHGYVWFLPSWFTKQWYLSDEFNRRLHEHTPCTSADMRRAVQGHFSLNTAFLGHGDARIVGNVTVGQWEGAYNDRIAKLGLRESSPYASYAYDAVMVFALGLHALLTEDPSALESLHTDRTTQKFMQTLNELRFSGASGPVQFDGAERTGMININQHVGDSLRVVGQFRPDLNVTVALCVNESAVVWLTATGARPSDGSPLPKLCTIEGFRSLLGVECDTAIVIANIIGISVFIILMLLCLVIVKKRYDAKVKRIRDELGLPVDADFAGLDKWQIAREHVVINRKVGEGAFGTVYGGEAQIDGIWVAVAVKALKLGTSMETKLDFVSEAEMMKRLDHRNIIKLLGVCTRCEPVYAVMEFMLHGNLKNFLLARRCMVGEVTKEAEDVSACGLTRMALDVAHGLKYLSDSKFLHRDLACRNCLVHADKTVKIGDFGLARHIYDSDYYQYSKRGLFPVRWMAPESLSTGMFTVASDVWSYGVVLYEIITFGCLPYPTLTNKGTVDFVKAGNKIALPSQVSPKLEELIESCWAYDPLHRASINDLVARLTSDPTLVVSCLETPSSARLEELTTVLEFPAPQAPPRSRHRPPQRGFSLGSAETGVQPESPSVDELSEPFGFSASTAAGGPRQMDLVAEMEDSKARSSAVARRARAMARIPLLESFFRTAGLGPRSVSVEEKPGGVSVSFRPATAVVGGARCFEMSERGNAAEGGGRKPRRSESCVAGAKPSTEASRHGKDLRDREDCRSEGGGSLGSSRSREGSCCHRDDGDENRGPADRDETVLRRVSSREGNALLPRCMIAGFSAGGVEFGAIIAVVGETMSSLPPSLESRTDSDYCSQHSKDS